MKKLIVLIIVLFAHVYLAHGFTKEQIAIKIEKMMENNKAEFQDLYKKMDELIWYKYGQKQENPQTYTLEEWATFVNGYMNSSLSLRKYFAKHGDAEVFYALAMNNIIDMDIALKPNNVSSNRETYFDYRYKNTNKNTNRKPEEKRTRNPHAMKSFMKGLGIFVGFIIAIFIYFIPSLVAIFKGKNDSTAIFILNFALGFTYVGWVIALIWATIKDKNYEIKD